MLKIKTPFLISIILSIVVGAFAWLFYDKVTLTGGSELNMRVAHGIGNFLRYFSILFLAFLVFMAIKFRERGQE